MTKSEIKDKYFHLKPAYSRLGSNLEEAVKGFLEEHKIIYLDVNHRIKKFNLLYDKIKRKNYTEPFEQMEDFCALRIICYYVSDIVRIENFIQQEFEVLESQDKSELLQPKEFAYRSTHYIVRIQNEWTVAPNYRGLDKLKAEIQIRTILMHAWAEIEHKLNYKSDAQVPDLFLRKLYMLSAKFEEADEQFEGLKNGIEKYQSKVTQNAVKQKGFDTTQDFNLNSFVAFMHYHLKEYEIGDNDTISENFDLMVKLNIGFNELEQSISIMKKHIKKFVADLVSVGYDPLHGFNAIEVLTFSLDVTSETFFEAHSPDVEEWLKTVNNWQEKIKAANRVNG